MTPTELREDGSVVVHALAVPERGLAEAVERRRALTAIGVATIASLLFAAVAIPRVDFEGAATARLERPGPGTEEGAQEPTAHDLDAAAATARKLGTVSGWTGAALSPTLFAAVAAVFLFAGFRVAGTRPGFKETFAVAAHGMLPVWLSSLLAIPAAVRRAPIPPDELPLLLPSSLAALAPAGAPPPLVAALSSVNLFALWAVALVAAGMARASGASRRRALTVTIVLYVAYVALLKVVPAAAVGDPGGGPKP